MPRSALPSRSPSPGGRLRTLYAKHFADPRQERRLLSTVGFFGAFSAARAVTHAIHDGVGPLGNMSAGGKHIHHMTFGILGMLATGTLWINQVGTGHNARERRASRVTATLFGAGAALTLDEFALWLNLEDDYWKKQGRESIDAVAIYGSLMLVALHGRSLIGELAQLPVLDSRARRRARLKRMLGEPRQVLALVCDPSLLRKLLS